MIRGQSNFMGDDHDSLNGLQRRIGYTFRDSSLLERSLSHPSLQQDRPGVPINQRLEFLGDAVLQLIVSEKLHALFPEEREGELTRRRAMLTHGAFLSGLARELGVHEVLRVSVAERATGGAERPAALEDATEALVAAIYLDSDWETVRRVVLPWFGDIEQLMQNDVHELNPKGRLQELVQPRHGNGAVTYAVVATEGPPHQPRFQVEVKVLEETVGQGWGSSKKEAEETAAREALKNWPPQAG